MTMSRRDARKSGPESWVDIAALVLLALGALFSLLGLLGCAIPLPVKEMTMSRRDARKSGPESWVDIAALVLLALGALFSLLGLLGCAIPLPVKDGEARAFLPVGLALLTAGGACALWAGHRKAKRARLLAEGQPVPGEILEIRHHIFITWNDGGAFCGGACALWAGHRKAKRARLLAEGQPVPGEILEIRHHIFITWNDGGAFCAPGKNSPWSLLCRYVWEDRAYTVRSPLLWQEPVRSGLVIIYLDPERPGRAAVDLDSVTTIL